MADGSLLFDTKLDETGIESGLSSLKKTIAALGIGKMIKDVSQQVWEVGSSFETSFSKASTLFGDVSVDTDNLKSKIADMSKQTGISAEELNETLYQAMSAGIPVTEDMGTALAAVQTAAKLSVGGFTSSSTAMSGLTTAINAYGLSADDAGRIADEFIQVQNKGVTTVDELASNMGRAISTGSAYGVNLENLNAAYISLTKGGISTAESTTYLSSMMNELGDSGSGVGKVLQDKTGMSFSQLMDNGYSLADVLDILMASVDGDSSALMNLWGSAEAGKAANAILTQGTDNFRQSLDDLGNSSGTTEDAYSTMMDTADGKMKQVKQTANDLFIKLFEKAEPVIMAGFNAFGYLLDNLDKVAAVVAPFGSSFCWVESRNDDPVCSAGFSVCTSGIKPVKTGCRRCICSARIFEWSDQYWRSSSCIADGADDTGRVCFRSIGKGTGSVKCCDECESNRNCYYADCRSGSCFYCLME